MTGIVIRACLSVTLVFAVACGPSSPADDDGVDAGIADLPDEDGDGIADVHEGRSENIDTDSDGVPDYLDDDSDGDGIPDYREGGDNLSGTPPFDSDSDGIPDFRDTDSDNNGRDDGVDGVEDLDGDGVSNFADLDDDNDSLLDEYEINGAPQNPPDTDSDGDFDFQDIDSDADKILDFHERASDPDLDEIPAYIDTDADGDCIPDMLEAGDDDLDTMPVDSDDDSRPDYLDLDSDNDGLADGTEDANCNGLQDGDESSATDDDSDGDGVSDMIEAAAGTDPNDNTDNPQQNGDFVFIVPYEAPPDPLEDDLDFSTNLKIVDVYMLVDRSGSMTGEITSIRDNIATVLNNLTCPPLGSGGADCISDLWSGAGGIGYTGSGADAYRNYLDLQSNPAATGPSLNVAEPGGCCDEILTLAVWSTVTGLGSSSSGCGVSYYGARGSCDTSPAGPTGFGYPCFRTNALPVVLFATDEAISSSDTYDCPTITVLAAAANAVGAKIVGIQGAGGGTALTGELQTLATATGAVDAANGNAPLVFNGADAGAATAIENGIRTLANGIPLDISALPVDDASDAVDAVTEFVDHLETLQLGTAECADGLTDQDTNADSFPDEYLAVLPGTPVCWKLVPKSNTSVPGTEEPQLFKATIEVYGDDTTLLDTREVFFLVPPEIIEVPID